MGIEYVQNGSIQIQYRGNFSKEGNNNKNQSYTRMGILLYPLSIPRLNTAIKFKNNRNFLKLFD